MFGIFKRSNRKTKELPSETRQAMQERINSFRAENKALREELDLYRSREREVADALNFARERANEYLKEARIRFGLEAARLNDFKARIVRRLEKLGSAEKVGEELNECEAFFAAAAKELDELASGKRVKHTPEEEYRREIERLEFLGKDAPPVTEPVKVVPKRLPESSPEQKPAPPEVFGSASGGKDPEFESEKVRIRSVNPKRGGEIPKSIFDRHPQPAGGIGAVRGELFPDLVRDVVKYAEKMGYREELSSLHESADAAENTADPEVLSGETEDGERIDDTASGAKMMSAERAESENAERTSANAPERQIAPEDTSEESDGAATRGISSADAANGAVSGPETVTLTGANVNAKKRSAASVGAAPFSARKNPRTLSDDELSGLLAQVYREPEAR